MHQLTLALISSLALFSYGQDATAQISGYILAPGNGFWHCDDARTLGIARPKNCPESKVVAPRTQRQPTQRQSQPTYTQPNRAAAGIAAGVAALEIFASMADFLEAKNAEANQIAERIEAQAQQYRHRMSEEQARKKATVRTAMQLYREGREEQALAMLRRAFASSNFGEGSTAVQQSIHIIRASTEYRASLNDYDRGKMTSAQSRIQKASFFASTSGNSEIAAKIEKHRSILFGGAPARQTCHTINGNTIC